MPLEWVAIRQAGQNDKGSGSLEGCMRVPAVTEVSLPQGAHSQVQALVCSDQALPAPQAGQTKPSGQRAVNRYRTQAASSGKRLWNSIRECGKSDTSGSPASSCSLYVLSSTDAFHHH